MTVTDRVGMPVDELRALEARLAGQTTLERVLRWGAAEIPRKTVEEIVTQDEYTHDVLVPWERGCYLVYGVT